MVPFGTRRKIWSIKLANGETYSIGDPVIRRKGDKEIRETIGAIVPLWERKGDFFCIEILGEKQRGYRLLSIVNPAHIVRIDF